MASRRTLLHADEQRAFRAFAGAARVVLTAVDRDLERAVGMPRAYIEILYHLDEAPGKSLRMSDLAEAMHSQPSRITHAVARLEEVGHVRRELCAADRRGWFAVLTDTGHEALEEAAPFVAQSVRRRFCAQVSPADRREVTRIGELLLERLGGADPTDTKER